MPQRRLVAAFFTLWITLGIALLVASVRTLEGALRSGAHGHAHLALLAGAEALAALLFLIPPTMRVGAVGLLVTVGIAFVAHMLRGEFPMILLLYAAATAFVLVHGPVPWGALLGRPVDLTGARPR
jgi:hypothetical protein